MKAGRSADDRELFLSHLVTSRICPLAYSTVDGRRENMASENSERLTVTSEIFGYFKKEAIDGSPGGKFGLSLVLCWCSFYP